MKRLRGVLAMLDRCKPTRSEWAALAIRAAGRAGLCPEDVASLRTNLDNQRKLDGRLR